MTPSEWIQEIIQNYHINELANEVGLPGVSIQIEEELLRYWNLATTMCGQGYHEQNESLCNVTTFGMSVLTAFFELSPLVSTLLIAGSGILVDFIPDNNPSHQDDFLQNEYFT